MEAKEQQASREDPLIDTIDSEKNRRSVQADSAKKKSTEHRDDDWPVILCCCCCDVLTAVSVSNGS
jgi:hypothetical protein